MSKILSRLIGVAVIAIAPLVGAGPCVPGTLQDCFHLVSGYAALRTSKASVGAAYVVATIPDEMRFHPCRANSIVISQGENS